MKKTATLLACLLLLILAKAQLVSGFAKGTLTFKDGRQLSGLIKDEPIKLLNYRLYFKKTEQATDLVKYDTGSLQRVQFDRGEVFESLTISLSGQRDSLQVLGFLLLKGKASLYRFSYKDRISFIVTNGTGAYSLENDEQFSAYSIENIPHHFKERLDAVLGLHETAFIERINAMDYEENSFIKVISEYNQAFKSENLLMNRQFKSEKFLILGLSGSLPGGSIDALAFEAVARFYTPKISNESSINLGLQYYSQKSAQNIPGTGYYYHREVVGIPLYAQQNFLNGRIRPYIRAGIQVSFYQNVDEFGLGLPPSNLQRNMMVNFLLSAGIEANLIKGLIIRAGYGFDVDTHSFVPEGSLGYAIKFGN